MQLCNTSKKPNHRMAVMLRMYSLALDRSKKVSCASSDVGSLSKDDYEWLVAIQKPVDRFQVYSQQEKLEAIKRLKFDDKVWVSTNQ